MFFLTVTHFLYHCFIAFICHNSSTQQLHLSLACDQSFSKRDIVCVQFGPRWVAIGPVPTLLSKTLGPSVAGGNLAQNHKRPTTTSNNLLFRIVMKILWKILWTLHFLQFFCSTFNGPKFWRGWISFLMGSIVIEGV